MKIGLITNEIFENRQTGSVGSSRIRGEWIIRNWHECELYKIGKKYDAIIFQKAYFTRFLKLYDGIKILDLCDPDWLDGRPVKETIEMCDAVTCSSEGLTNFVQGITKKPVFHIPDRVYVESFLGVKKKHTGLATQVVWYGYSSNFKALDSALFTIRRFNLTLTVISEFPYAPASSVEGVDDDWIKQNIRFIKYNQDSFPTDLIMNGDMVLNPKMDVGRFKFKSDNKTVIAWALGMPVAKNSEEVERFMNDEERKKEADVRYQEVMHKWQSKHSVEEYKKVIEYVLTNKEQVAQPA